PAAHAGWPRRQVRFLLAWIIPAWIAFELVITKLPHYVLPLYPAIAILIARTLERGTLSDTPRLRWVTMGWPLVAALLPMFFLVLLMVVSNEPGFLAWPLIATAMALGFIAWREYEVHTAAHSLLLAGAAALLVYGAVFGILIPSLRVLFPSPALAHALSAYSAGCERPQIASAGYHEPSLVFLAGTDVRLTTGAGAAELLHQGSCRFALIERRQERAFKERATALGLRYTAGPRVQGFNLNGGRTLAITIYRSAEAP
ncbi:MAG TPA: glycosyl transferase, partial [Xanthobacteraceae bacterium]|nr:glycosyl transferase [Xanthobacteraceae bacterium]